MELEELRKLQDLTELDLLYKIIEVAQRQKKNAELFLKGKKISGSRLRDGMQDIRFLAETIRDKVQDGRGIQKGKKRKNKLELAIKKEELRLQEEDKIINRLIGQEGDN